MVWKRTEINGWAANVCRVRKCGFLLSWCRKLVCAGSIRVQQDEICSIRKVRQEGRCCQEFVLLLSLKRLRKHACLRLYKLNFSRPAAPSSVNSDPPPTIFEIQTVVSNRSLTPPSSPSFVAFSSLATVSKTCIGIWQGNGSFVAHARPSRAVPMCRHLCCWIDLVFSHRFRHGRNSRHTPMAWVDNFYLTSRHKTNPGVVIEYVYVYFNEFEVGIIPT